MCWFLFSFFLKCGTHREQAAHIDMNRLHWVTNVSVQNGPRTNVFNQIAQIVIWLSKKHGKYASLLFLFCYLLVFDALVFGSISNCFDWQFISYVLFLCLYRWQKSNTMLLGEQGRMPKTTLCIQAFELGAATTKHIWPHDNRQSKCCRYRTYSNVSTLTFLLCVCVCVRLLKRTS